MKKISVKKYAAALYQATVDADKRTITDRVANFLRLLRKNKHLKLAERIVVEFNRQRKVAEGIVEATVVSSRPLSGALRSELAAALKKNYNGKTVNLEMTEDSQLLGGLVVKVGDEIVDASLKTRLELLEQHLR